MANYIKRMASCCPPSGASALSELTDVNIENPVDGQMLQYNGSTGKWEAVNGSGSSDEWPTYIDSTEYYTTEEWYNFWNHTKYIRYWTETDVEVGDVTRFFVAAMDNGQQVQLSSEIMYEPYFIVPMLYHLPPSVRFDIDRYVYYPGNFSIETDQETGDSRVIWGYYP